MLCNVKVINYIMIFRSEYKVSCGYGLNWIMNQEFLKLNISSVWPTGGKQSKWNVFVQTISVVFCLQAVFSWQVTSQSFLCVRQVIRLLVYFLVSMYVQVDAALMLLRNLILNVSTIFFAEIVIFSLLISVGVFWRSSSCSM